MDTKFESPHFMREGLPSDPSEAWKNSAEGISRQPVEVAEEHEKGLEQILELLK
jgi:hypothetical protein